MPSSVVGLELVDAYRRESIEFVANESIWMENEAQFADVILPVCRALERDDMPSGPTPAATYSTARLSSTTA